MILKSATKILAVFLASTCGWFSGELARHWCQSEAASQLQAAATINPSSGDQSPSQRDILLQAKEVAGLSGQFERSVRALALVENATPTTLRKMMLLFSEDESLQEIVTIRWAEVDPQGMATFIDNGSNQFGYAIELALFSTWASSDPDAAWDYAAANQGRMEYGNRGAFIIEDLVRSDITAAMRLITRNPDLIHTEENWQWEGNDLARAADLVSALPPCFFKNALSGIVDDWVAQDPAMAIAWLRKPDKGEHLSDHINTIAPTLVEKNMALAQKLFRDSETPEVTRVLGRQIASSIAKSDPLKAVEWAEKELSAGNLNDAISSIAYEVSSTDAQLAIEIYERLPRDETYRFLVGEISSQLLKDDQEAALRWATGLEQLGERKEAVDSIRHAVFYGQSPQAAVALLKDHPENVALGTIAEEFAKRYSGADGIEWAQKLPPIHGETLTRKVFDNWARNSPQSAAEYLRSGTIPDHLRTPAISALARRWFNQAPGQAADWARETLTTSQTPEVDQLAIVRAIRVANLTTSERSTAIQHLSQYDPAK